MVFQSDHLRDNEKKLTLCTYLKCDANSKHCQRARIIAIHFPDVGSNPSSNHCSFLSNFLTSNAENFLTVNRRFCARLVSHAVDSMSSWSYALALIYSHRLDKYKFVAWDIQEKLEPNEHMFSTNALKWSETRLRRKQTIVCIFFGHLALQCI